MGWHRAFLPGQEMTCSLQPIAEVFNLDHIKIFAAWQNYGNRYQYFIKSMNYSCIEMLGTPTSSLPTCVAYSVLGETFMIQ